MVDLEQLGITKDMIVQHIAEQFFDEEDVRSKIMYDVKQIIIKRTEGKIDGILTEALSELVDRPFQEVDSWGDPKGNKTTLRELVKTKATGYLTEKVTDKGETGYHANMTRAAYLANKAAADCLTYEIKSEITKAVEQAKTEVKRLVAQHIQTILLK